MNSEASRDGRRRASGACLHVNDDGLRTGEEVYAFLPLRYTCASGGFGAQCADTKSTSVGT